MTTVPNLDIRNEQQFDKLPRPAINKKIIGNGAIEDCWGYFECDKRYIFYSIER